MQIVQGQRYFVCLYLSYKVTRHLRPLFFNQVNLHTSPRSLQMVFKYSLCRGEGRGDAVPLLFEALCYMPEGCGFDSRWSHWNFSLTKSFQPHNGPGIDSASDRHEYQEYFLGSRDSRCVWLMTLPLSCANCHEIWEFHPPGTLRACPGPWWDCFACMSSVQGDRQKSSS